MATTLVAKVARNCLLQHSSLCLTSFHTGISIHLFMLSRPKCSGSPVEKCLDHSWRNILTIDSLSGGSTSSSSSSHRQGVRCTGAGRRCGARSEVHAARCPRRRRPPVGLNPETTNLSLPCWTIKTRRRTENNVWNWSISSITLYYVVSDKYGQISSLERHRLLRFW